MMLLFDDLGFALEEAVASREISVLHSDLEHSAREVVVAHSFEAGHETRKDDRHRWCSIAAAAAKWIGILDPVISEIADEV